mgnify:CR=1 FL=1
MEGVGKRTTARALAMAVNCAAGEEAVGPLPCGDCGPCRRIAVGSHPDVLVLEPAGREFRIDQVRELCRELALKPYEGRHRVALIAGAERMTPHAANALLKVLEEPPERTLLVLTAPQAADLLPTIVSRCRQLRFKPLAARHLAAILERAHGVPAAKAVAVAATAGGSVTRALAMLREGWPEKRRRLLAELPDLAGGTPLRALFLAASLSRARSEAEEVLGVVASWVRDLAFAAEGAEQLVNRDMQGEIAEAAGRLPPDFAPRAWEAVQRAERRLAANVQPRTVLEALFLEIAAAGSPPVRSGAGAVNPSGNPG